MPENYTGFAIEEVDMEFTPTKWALVEAEA